MHALGMTLQADDGAGLFDAVGHKDVRNGAEALFGLEGEAAFGVAVAFLGPFDFKLAVAVFYRKVQKGLQLFAGFLLPFFGVAALITHGGIDFFD